MAGLPLPLAVDGFMRYAAQQGMLSRDLLQTLGEGLRPAGITISFQQYSQVLSRYAVLRSAVARAANLQAAISEFMSTGRDQTITADMIGLETNARSQQDRNLAPLTHVRVGVQVQDLTTGQVRDDRLTLTMPGGLPATVGSLLDTLQQELPGQAAGSDEELVGISGDIALNAL